MAVGDLTMPIALKAVDRAKREVRKAQRGPKRCRFGIHIINSGLAFQVPRRI